MEINLFHTNVEELNAKLANTVWQVNDVELTVKDVYVNNWTGGYCVNLADGSWGRVATLLERGKQIN